MADSMSMLSSWSCHRPSALKECVQEEEEGIGDVDLFTLTSDKDKLTVNCKWFQHLQVSIKVKSVQAVFETSINVKQPCWQAILFTSICVKSGAG